MTLPAHIHQCLCGTAYNKKAFESCPSCGKPTLIPYETDPLLDRSGQIAQPELPDREGQLALAPKAQEPSPERVHLRIVSVRKRLLDPDNLVPKWTIDCLRYCRIIRDDTPEAITLEVGQRKSAKGEAEHTLIELYQP